MLQAPGFRLLRYIKLQPQGAIFGPKVMIINEFAGSGGETLCLGTSIAQVSAN